jgi:hypothetical protein
MAASAAIIKNLLISLSVDETVAGIKPKLLIRASAKNPKINQGNKVKKFTLDLISSL